MKALLLLILVPCLIAADTPCTDSNISCPDGKRSCEVDGRHTCCDVDDEIANVNVRESQTKVYAGDYLSEYSRQYPNVSLIGVMNGRIPGGCNQSNCDGKCCSETYCCEPAGNWTCCPDNKCCPPGKVCCRVGCCPNIYPQCCGIACCYANDTCCGNWCCEKQQKCGPSYKICINTATGCTPTIATALLLAVAAVMSRHL